MKYRFNNDPVAVDLLKKDVQLIATHSSYDYARDSLVNFAGSAGAGLELSEKVKMARTYGASDAVVAEIVTNSINGKTW